MKTFAIVVGGSLLFAQKETKDEAITFGNSYKYTEDTEVTVTEVNSLMHTTNSVKALKAVDGCQFYFDF